MSQKALDGLVAGCCACIFIGCIGAISIISCNRYTPTQNIKKKPLTKEASSKMWNERTNWRRINQIKDTRY